MKHLITISTTLALLCFSIQTFGQDSLQVKYDNLIKESETFQQYKVIPKTALDAFWLEAKDSLSQLIRSTQGLKVQIDRQEETIKSLNSQVATVQESLNESLGMNDTIHFIGIPFSKIAYHILVWVIIIVLVVLGGMGYTMFLRSNKQTTRFKRELESLSREFEDHKDKAREQQMKLKRELQTAINKLSEKR